MAEVSDILEAVVANLTFTEPIDSIIDNGDGTATLNVCKTYWIQPTRCSKITIDAVEYPVSDVVNNQSITIVASVQPTGSEYTVSAPKFFNGTRLVINEELSNIRKESDKLPFVSVFEVIREDFPNNEESIIDRTATLRVLFCGVADYENWNQADHEDKCITPMRNLVNEFVNYLNDDNCQFGDYEYSLFNHAKLGVFTEGVGHTTQLFNEEISGVEMRFSVPIYKSFACNGACN